MIKICNVLAHDGEVHPTRAVITRTRPDLPIVEKYVVTEPIEQTPDAPSDAALIAAVRRGDTSAYGVLYERHLGAAKRASMCFAGTAAEREDLVAEAFTRVLRVLRRGHGPTEGFRAYLLATMRNTAIDTTRRGIAFALYGAVPDAYLQAASDDQVTVRSHLSVAAHAFAGLPERWRIVLWHTEVEGESPTAIAPLLGLTPNGVSALAYRAREGLRQAYLRMHLPAADRRDCRAATDKLAGLVRQSISPTQLTKIKAHLDRCARCRDLAARLAEVNGELRAALAPLATVSCLSALKAGLTATAAAAVAATAITAAASAPATHPDTGTAGPGPATAIAPPPVSASAWLPGPPLAAEPGPDRGPVDPPTPRIPITSAQSDATHPGKKAKDRPERGPQADKHKPPKAGANPPGKERKENDKHRR